MKLYSKKHLLIALLSSALSTSCFVSPSHGMLVEDDLSAFTTFGHHTHANADEDMRFFWSTVLQNDAQEDIKRPQKKAKESHWAQAHMENNFWSGTTLQKIEDLDIRKLAQVAFENRNSKTQNSINHPQLGWYDEARLQSRALEIIDNIKTRYEALVENFIICNDSRLFLPELKQILTRTSGEPGQSCKTPLGIGLKLEVLEEQAMIAKEAFYYGEYIPLLKAIGTSMTEYLAKTCLFPVRGKLEGYLTYVQPLIDKGFDEELLSQIINIYTANENYFFKFANGSLAGDYPQHIAPYIAALETAVNTSPHKLEPDVYKNHQVYSMTDLPEDQALMKGNMYVEQNGHNVTIKVLDPNNETRILEKTFAMDSTQEISPADILAEASRQHCIVHRGALFAPIEVLMMAHKKQFFLPSFVSTSTEPQKAYYHRWNSEESKKYKASMENLLAHIKHNENFDFSKIEFQNMMFEINIKDNRKTALVRNQSNHDEEECLLSPYNFYEWKGMKVADYGNEMTGADKRIVVMLDLIDHADADSADNPNYKFRLTSKDPGNTSLSCDGTSSKKLKLSAFRQGDNLMCKIDGKAPVVVPRATDGQLGYDAESYDRVMRTLAATEYPEGYSLKLLSGKSAASSLKHGELGLYLHHERGQDYLFCVQKDKKPKLVIASKNGALSGYEQYISTMCRDRILNTLKGFPSLKPKDRDEVFQYALYNGYALPIQMATYNKMLKSSPALKESEAESASVPHLQAGLMQEEEGQQALANFNYQLAYGQMPERIPEIVDAADVMKDKEALCQYAVSSGYSRRQVPGCWFANRVSEVQRTREISPDTLAINLQVAAKSYQNNCARKPDIFLSPEGFDEMVKEMIGVVSSLE